MDKLNSEFTTLKVNVKDEFYRNKDFHIYGGEIQKAFHIEEISIQTTGFELVGGGEKELYGYEKKYKGNRTFVCIKENLDLNDYNTKLNILCQIKGLGFKKAIDIVEVINNLEDFKTKDFNELPEIKGIKKNRIKFFNEIKELLIELDNNNMLQEIKVMFHGKLNQQKLSILTNVLNANYENLSKEINEKISGIIDRNNKTLAPLQKNPYTILIDLVECSFPQADRLALEVLHIDRDNSERIEFLSEYLLNKEVEKSGSSFTSKESFIKILDNENYVEDSEDFIKNNERIIVEDGNLFPSNLYKGEKIIADVLYKINNQSNEYEEELIKNLIKNYESQLTFKYDTSQKKAIISLINNSVSCLLGGAGCGKTTVLSCVLYCLKKLGYDTTCCAPTGKASCRIHEATGEESSTLHSFYYKNISEDFEIEIESKKSKAFIIDESSMIDIDISSKVLRLIYKMGYNKIIFVGDPFQLSSVGAGNILKDIVDSKKINICFLNTIHRQGEGNKIIEFSQNVRKQKLINFVEQTNQLYCKKICKTEDYIKSIFRFYDHIKSKQDYKDNLDLFYNDFQVIIPQKNGEIGVNEINKRIKAKYNPGIYRENKIEYTFKKNDKVMCIKNKKNQHVFNGDVGRVLNVTKDDFTVFFHSSKREVIFNSDFRNDFTLAYVCTVHKLQGSEYKYVLFVINQNSPHIDSCLLYTGVTRAKDTCIIVSNKELINNVISRKNLNFRNTMLKQRLIKIFESGEL
jgi:exodeoxyribonuclease V alpha subunit